MIRFAVVKASCLWLRNTTIKEQKEKESCLLQLRFLYRTGLRREAAADLDAAAAERTEANSRPRTPPDPFKARTLVRNWGRDEDPDIAETSQSLQYTTEIDSLKRHAPFMSAHRSRPCAIKGLAADCTNESGTLPEPRSTEGLPSGFGC